MHPNFSISDYRKTQSHHNNLKDSVANSDRMCKNIIDIFPFYAARAYNWSAS